MVTAVKTSKTLEAPEPAVVTVEKVETKAPAPKPKKVAAQKVTPIADKFKSRTGKRPALGGCKICGWAVYKGVEHKGEWYHGHCLPKQLVEEKAAKAKVTNGKITKANAVANGNGKA